MGFLLSMFPQSFSSFEAIVLSDHARCVIKGMPSLSSGRKSFKFFNFIKDHPQYLETMHRSRMKHRRFTILDQLCLDSMENYKLLNHGFVS